MIKIAGKDFNLDMDRYIKNRRTKSEPSRSVSKTLGERFQGMKDSVEEWKLFSLFKKKDDDVYVDDINSQEEDFSEEESEIEAIDEMEDELEDRRESALTRFFKKLRFSGRRRVDNYDDDVDDYDEENEDYDDLDDIKDVIKITHKWLERLPPEELERFKRGEDFQKYKAILKKLGMIK